MDKRNLMDKKIVIVTHVYATGPGQDLRDYLVSKKTKEVMFIGHPLFYNFRLNGSGYELYKEGIEVLRRYSKIRKALSYYSYSKSFILNIYWILRSGTIWDLYVGCNNLNALGGIVLRGFGKVRKVVYYVVDYNPKRFNNILANKIYHLIDQFCVKHSDETWNLSQRMIEGRRDFYFFEGGNQKVVPLGIWFFRIKRPAFKAVKKTHLVFMGHILKDKGVQYIIDAIPEIIGKVPKFKFVVIGEGNYLNTLKQQVENIGVKDYVDFKGYIADHKEAEILISKCACAAAPYKMFEYGTISYTYFADPGKLKAYLACGLPVIVTDVSFNAKEIQEKECGLIIELEKRKIAKAVIKLMGDPKILEKYRNNAVSYAKNYDWENIFKENLERVFANDKFRQEKNINNYN